MSKNSKMASAKATSRQERLARAKLKARIAAIRKASEDEAEETIEEMEDEVETKEEDDAKEARALARKARRIHRACLKKAQELIDENPECAECADIEEISDEVAQEAAEEVVENIDPEAPFEEIVDEVDEAVEDALEEILAKRTASKTKEAEDSVSDDLEGPEGDSSNIDELHSAEVSDDLEETDEKVPTEVAQEPPASVSEAEDKIAAAYDLIEMQMSRGVIAGNIRKSSLASKYAKEHTTGEMRFAAEQLRAVNSTKSANAGVRVQRRSAGIATTKSASTDGDMSAELLFA